ncbi:ABC transporter substrate-binding protein [Pseudonocardia sp.]|uniref:ABC transporter substrate-binding protein n=1 Tax=Pseudonocardia sp. TaxID=60912 RepID=UPI003D13DEB4
MSTWTRRFLTAWVGVVTAGALVACGGASDGPGAAPGAAGPAGPPVPGGTATFLVYTEPARLDPAALVNSSTADSTIGNALYGQLLVDDPASGGVVPRLAESLTTTDGLDWVLDLRDGVTFSDGSPLDAAAVVANWNRHKDRAVGSRSASAAQAVAAATPAGRTVTIRLTEPNRQFPQLVVNSAMNWIASPAALQGGTGAFDANPVGAGPFVLREWRRQDQLVLARNSRYYDPPRPYLDQLVVKAIPDNESRLSTLQSAGADAAIANVEMAGRAGQADLWVAKDELDGITANIFNTRKAPFDDPAVRRAVVQAIDLDGLTEVLYKGHEQSPRAMFRETAALHESGLDFVRFDRDAAQREFDRLAAAGTPLSFTLTVLNLSETVTMAQAVQAQLQGYRNVTVAVQAVDSSTRAAQLANGNFDVVNVNMAFGDPEPLLYQSLKTGSPQNYSGITDPQLDAALLDGRTSGDLPGRKDAYRRVQQRWNELNPAIPISSLASLVVVRPETGGIGFYGNGSVVVDGVWKAS